jgi:hypothetical protein
MKVREEGYTRVYRDADSPPMTVRDVIEQLGKFPPTTEVYILSQYEAVEEYYGMRKADFTYEERHNELRLGGYGDS